MRNGFTGLIAADGLFLDGATPYQQFFTSVNGDAALKIFLTAQKEGGLLIRKGVQLIGSQKVILFQIISRTSYSSLKFKVKKNKKKKKSIKNEPSYYKYNIPLTFCWCTNLLNKT